jgi:hypothetical protein
MTNDLQKVILNIPRLRDWGINIIHNKRIICIIQIILSRGITRGECRESPGFFFTVLALHMCKNNGNIKLKIAL